MGGREAVPEMHFTRMPCADPEVAVFGISGSLGPRARPYLERLTNECRQREMRCVVLDLSQVDSLGGGTAQLLNVFAAERDAAGLTTCFVVTSPIVRSFLCRDPDKRPMLFKSLEDAIDSTQPEESVPESDPPTNTLTPRFVEDASWDASLGQLMDRDEPDEEAVRVTIERALHESHLGSRVHILSLQPDGNYHPVTHTGVDLERGIPSGGALAEKILAHNGPALLFDLCNEPLTDLEEDVVAVLNCEVVARFERAGSPRMLVFLSKEQPGDEYTMDELARLETLLDSVAIDATDMGTRAAPEIRETATWNAPSDHDTILFDNTEPESSAVATHSESESENTLQRKVAKLHQILRLGRGFDTAVGSSRILDVLVLSLVSVTRSESVLYFGKRLGEFHLTHHRGVDPQALSEMKLSADASLATRALNADGATSIDSASDVSQDEKAWARKYGFQYIIPFRSNGNVLGLLVLGGAAPVELDPEILTYLLSEAALGYDRARIYETLEDRTLGVVRGLMTLIESRASHNAGSTENVVRYVQALAREIQYPQEQMRDLVYGTVLRDIGMLRIEQSTLAQTGQLSAGEWEDVRRHTIEGATIMRQMLFDDAAVEVVLHHHEAYNGEGYPMKLRGRAIPLGARIVAVAESYVKMTMDRPYRKALGRVEALESLAENWGLRYDPLIVDALVRVVNRELSIGLGSEVDFTNHLFGD